MLERSKSPSAPNHRRGGSEGGTGVKATSYINVGVGARGVGGLPGVERASTLPLKERGYPIRQEIRAAPAKVKNGASLVEREGLAQAEDKGEFVRSCTAPVDFSREGGVVPDARDAEVKSRG